MEYSWSEFRFIHGERIVEATYPHYMSHSQESRMSQTKLNKLFATVQAVLLWTFIIKSALAALAMLIHLSQTNNSIYKSSERLGWYLVSARIGNICRRLRNASVIGYCTYPWFGFTQKLVDFLWRHRRVHMKTSGLCHFLRDLSDEQHQITERISKQLEAMQASIELYKQYIEQYGSVSGYHRGNTKLDIEPNKPATRHSFGQVCWIHQTFSVTCAICRTGLFSSNELESGLEDDVADGTHATRIIFHDLDEQLGHLELLKSNMSSVWPPNRETGWHASILLIHMFFTCLTMSVYWLVGIGATLLCSSMSFRAIRASGDEFDVPEELFYMDYVEIPAGVLFVNFTSDWYFYPISLVTTGYFDQTKWLLHLRHRLVALHDRIRALRVACDRSLACQPHELSTHIDEFSRETQLLMVDKHKSSCSLEALEIYISMQMFRNEIQTHYLWCEYAIILTGRVVFIAICVLSSVVSKASVSAGAYYLLIVTFMAIINGLMYPVALLNRQCIDTTQIVWSVLAQAESFASDLEEYEHEPKAGGPSIVVIQAGSNQGPVGSATKKARKPTFHLIGPHTSMLWRRFIHDFDSIRNRFACRFFNLTYISFSTIIEFNFWFVSLIMLFFSGKPT